MLKKENYHIGKIKLLILLLSMISLKLFLYFYEDNDAVYLSILSKNKKYLGKN
jgi:hypothetical protein